MAHQSLYRRYRPRRFDEVRGQEHVIAALRNAVRNQSEGHAYLFSGPRGTGKTSTARILAKALNCESPQNGEPCCDCTPCADMEAGRSFDLFELDAASNNGVDAVRDLIERAAVGSPGRTKVYILDEVHMLSTAGSNALLKTLEEPPDHVRFVLATTDPQKVLPTIRSRTQHFEFQLLSARELEAQVRWIVSDAGLEVDDEAIAWVVQKGRGSSRDTLSALDQVAAAGGVVTRAEPVDQLYQALASRDPGQAVATIAEALAQGHDPRVLGSAFLDSLRDAFLVSLGVDVPHLVDQDRQRLERWAGELGTPTLTRSMEALGSALVDMRQAADPRVPLEVALVRLTAPDASSTVGLLERIERLEQALASGVQIAAPQGPAPAAAPPAASSALSSPVASSPGETEGYESEPAPPPPARPVAEAPVGAAASDIAAVPAAEPAASAGSGPAMVRAELARRRAAREGSNADSPAEAPRRRAERAAAPPVPGAPPRAPGTPIPPGAAPDGPTPDAPPVLESSTDVSSTDPSATQAPSTDASATGAPSPANTSSPSPISGSASSPDSAPAAASAPAPAPAGEAGDAKSSGELDSARLTAALAAVLPGLRAPAKAACQDGSFVSVGDGSAVFELGMGVPQRHAERFRPDVQAALSEHLGTAVTLEFVPSGKVALGGSGPVPGPAGDSPRGGTQEDADEVLEIDITELEDADDVAETGIDRLTRAFPGAVVVDEDEVTT